MEQHVFQSVMGGFFSARDLQARGVTIYVNGNAAWSEFQKRIGRDDKGRGKPTSTVKEAGRWRLVDVHYSEDRSRRLQVKIRLMVLRETSGGTIQHVIQLQQGKITLASTPVIMRDSSRRPKAMPIEFRYLAESLYASAACADDGHCRAP
jgi:hypothetical protein